MGSGSRQISVKDVNAFTKLKFRQPGQGTTTEINRRDLKLELERAEQAAKNKRKGIATGATNIDEEQGVPAPSLVPGAPVGATQGVEDEQAAKRRKLIEDAAELDKDDSDEEDGGDEVGVGDKVHTNGFGKGKGKAADGTDTAEGQDGQAKDAEDYGEEEDTDEEEDEDEEDETAELLRELEKIKRERAEEKERQVRHVSGKIRPSATNRTHTAGPRASHVRCHLCRRGGCYWQPALKSPSRPLRQQVLRLAGGLLLFCFFVQLPDQEKMGR